MKKIINNEGSSVTVSQRLYDELKSIYKNGYWMVTVNVDDKVHMIPLHENFSNV